MEVDAPPVPKHIKIHPLAIITISDHHTRIISGGSALPPSSTVIGLLFGTQTDNVISIVDAEEMDPTATASDGEGGNQLVKTKIELHRKVFPRHQVVGWYRVNKENSTESEPTQEDLRMNQIEISNYCQDESGPLFLLMNAASSEYTGDKKPSASDGLLDDDQLPLMVYETVMEQGSDAVFVNVEFELQTFEPERIAVEKVFKTAPAKPTKAAADVAKTDVEETRKVKKSKKEETSKQQQPEPIAQSELDVQLDSLQSSIRAMNARMRVLLDYLQKVQKGELPADPELLRSVDGLLSQLPLVYAALEEGMVSLSSSEQSVRRPLRELENEYNDTMLLSYLATVAKTAKTVHVYAEKYKGAFEASSGLRDISGRRGTGY